MMLLRIRDIWHQSKGIGQLSYIFRMMAYVTGIAILIRFNLENNFGFGLSEYAMISILLAFPHALLYLYVRKGRNINLIIQALALDFFLVGWSMGVMRLCIIPTIAFTFGAFTNHIAAIGLKKLYWVFLIPVGLGLSLLINGADLHFESSLTINYMTLAYGILHYVMNSYVLHVSIERVRNQNQEIKKQRVEIEEKSEELKVLNESLKDMNANLEQKVTSRTKELEIKNKKLKEYAFMNSHKLRAPVARILGLINLLDYKNIYDSELIVTQLQASATELDNMTKDIGARLEEDVNDALPTEKKQPEKSF